MKIIKTFESYSYYKEVSREDMFDIISTNDFDGFIDFTKNDIESIKNTISRHYNIPTTHFYVVLVNGDLKITIPHFLRPINYWDKNTKWRRTFKAGGHVIRSEYTVYKMIDEWFYLVVEKNIAEYYKCDQLEGLLHCLRDKLDEIEAG